MKTIPLLLAFLGIILLSACSNETTNNTSNNTTVSVTLPTQPERKVDIYGKVLSQEGNEITLSQVDTSKDPTFAMTPEEKKKYMQSLDEAARMALKEEINSAVLGEVKLTIPVGIPMIRKSAQGVDAALIEASLADIKVGGYISVWLNTSVTDQKIAEFVKISFIQ